MGHPDTPCTGTHGHLAKHLAPLRPLQDTQGQTQLSPREEEGAALGAGGARRRGWNKEGRDGELRRDLQGRGRGWREEGRDGERRKGTERGGKGRRDEEEDGGMRKRMQG